jgi:hypothetical protein
MSWVADATNEIITNTRMVVKFSLKSRKATENIRTA